MHASRCRLIPIIVAIVVVGAPMIDLLGYIGAAQLLSPELPKFPMW